VLSTAADAPALLELGSDAQVTRFFSWGPYTSLQEPVAYIAGLTGERARGERLDFLIVDHAAGPVGVTGLTELIRRDRRAVVGSWLKEEWEGSSLADVSVEVRGEPPPAFAPGPEPPAHANLSSAAAPS
jgi:RimJ/RimL family protein N-acetyltransferase